MRRALPTLDDLEADKLRTAIVLGSSTASAGAIRDFIDGDHGWLLHLALLRHHDPDEREDAVTCETGPALAELIHKQVRDPLPPNTIGMTSLSEVDPAMLLSVSRIVWFVEDAEQAPPAKWSGSYWCAMNVALGVSYGLPLSCRDARGEPVASPLTGLAGKLVRAELANWRRRRRRLTNRKRREGILFKPDWCEPALWGAYAGAIDAGALDLPLELIWRVRRLEMWLDAIMDALPTPFGEWPSEIGEAYDAEERACLDDLRRVIDTEVWVLRK